MPFLIPIGTAIAGAIGSVATAIGGAVAAIGSFIGGLGIFGQALVGIGLNVAAALVQKAFAKKPKQPVGGVQFDRQYGQDVPRQVACGLVGIAGHDCYINTYGKSNKYLQQIYTLSDYPSDGFSRLAINGEWVTLGSTEDPDKGWPVATGDFANLIWVKFLDGRQTAADSYLVDNANPSGRWDSDYIGVGETAALISMTYDKEKNNQFPDFFFEFRGARLYDWRKDSSVGGTGSHRWDDPSTHEYSENPIVIDYNYRRGFSVNGDLFCGMAMPASDLPLDKFTAAANICDETVGTELRYRCSIMLNAGPDTTHGDNIEAIMLSCGGMVVDGVDGSWPLVGSDQPVVMTLTDDDLITTEAVKFRAKRSMSELVNSVSGNFPDPDQLWSMVGYDPQISETAIAVDRRTRDLNQDFPQVRSSRQAAQLASIYLKENRYEATASATFRPRMQVLEPGDWVKWESDRYGTMTYIVSEASLASLSSDGPRNALLSLQQRDGSIYDGVSPPAIVVPVGPGTPSYLAEVQDFTVVAVSIGATDGRLSPGIRCGWSSIEDETVTAVEIQYYPTAQTDAVLYQTVPVGRTVALLTDGVVGNTEYTVKTKLITDPLRVTAWSADTTVTTGEYGPDFWPISLNDLNDDVTDLITDIGYNIRQKIDDDIAQVDDLLNSAASNEIAHQEIGRRATANLGAAKASFDERIDVVTTDTQALSQQITTLSANVDTNAASIQTEQQARADGDTALATSITALQASIGDVTAGGLISITANANPPSGVYSQIDIAARATVGGDVATAALSLQAYDDDGDLKSRALLVADQTMFVSGSGETVQVVLFDENGAYFANARIGTLTFDQLSSSNGNLVLKGSGSNASIEVFT